MEQTAHALVVGGTSGIGRAIAEALTRRGEQVTITGRDLQRARDVAAQIGSHVRALAVDLCAVDQIGDALSEVGEVTHLVLCAIERDANEIMSFDAQRALKLVTLKLVGYAEVVHVLASRFSARASIVLLGGLAKERPYPGSTMVSTVNGGVMGLVHTLAVELAPRRVNGVHPGIISDTKTWSGRPREVLRALEERTPTGRLCTTVDVTGAVLFLLDNAGVNGVNLNVDGGWLLK